MRQPFVVFLLLVFAPVKASLLMLDLLLTFSPSISSSPSLVSLMCVFANMRLCVCVPVCARNTHQLSVSVCVCVLICVSDCLALSLVVYVSECKHFCFSLLALVMYDVYKCVVARRRRQQQQC